MLWGKFGKFLFRKVLGSKILISPNASDGWILTLDLRFLVDCSTNCATVDSYSIK
jgi:hypothetical protein